MKPKVLKALALVGLIILPLIGAKAAGTKTGSIVSVGKDEIINGSLYAIGEKVTIDGTVSGDLIALARTIVVNGRVEGDIIAAGQDITVNGTGGGNIRIAGDNLTVNGSAARNANLFGSAVIFGPDSRIGWDVYLAAASGEIRGIIDGSLQGKAGQIMISGKIGKDVNLTLSGDTDKPELTVEPTAVINGDLNYTSTKPGSIAKEASIAGKIQQQYAQPEKNDSVLWRLWQKLFSVLAALVVGLALIYFGKTVTTNILARISESPAKALLPGIIIMFALPIAALLLIVTLIGIPLALILSAWLISASYIAKIYASIFAGQFLLKKAMKKEPSLLWSLLLGVIGGWLVFSIPYVGWVIGLFAIWLGLGGIWFYSTGQLAKN